MPFFVRAPSSMPRCQASAPVVVTSCAFVDDGRDATITSPIRGQWRSETDAQSSMSIASKSANGDPSGSHTRSATRFVGGSHTASSMRPDSRATSAIGPAGGMMPAVGRSFVHWIAPLASAATTTASPPLGFAASIANTTRP